MKRIIALLGVGALLLCVGPACADPITYTGYVLSDVKIGRQLYRGAQVYLSFRADTSTALTFNDSTGYGYRNEVGTGRVTIVTGRETITARFAPNQVYVFFDVAHSSIGFGSYMTAGRGYPLVVTALEDHDDGLTENSSVGAVADIIRNPADMANYSSDVVALKTDLKNETALSGAVSSCVQFDVTTSTCSNFVPVALKTERGDLLLYEPFTVDDSVPPVAAQRHSVNWGFFWSTKVTAGKEGDEVEFANED